MERRSANLGFTPLYQSLGESLLAAHSMLVASAAHCERGRATAVVKALVAVVKHMPYKKLGLGPLEESLKLSRKMLDDPNPVARIAGLNLHSATLAAGAPLAKSRWKDAAAARDLLDFDGACKMLLGRAFPGKQQLSMDVSDNNVRYVALQSLAGLAAVHPDCLESNADLLASTVEEAVGDNDDAILLHTLRFYKTLSKLDPSREESRGDGGSLFRSLWNQVLHQSLLSRPITCINVF